MAPSNTASEFSLNQIDLNLLRAFDVLMQERSVTRAAQRLGRTQSAVSHSLSKLRQIFRDELFQRDSGFMEPTARAKELALVISRSLTDIRVAVDRHLNFEPSETVRKFRIGLSDYTAVKFLPLLVDRFSAVAPNATLNVIHAREREFISSLKNREVECAVLGNPDPVEGPLTVIELSRDRMVCAGWAGNTSLDAFSEEKYLEARHLQISADGLADGVADMVLRPTGRTRKVVATIPHYLVAPWVIKGTDLITVFGDSVLLALPAESELRILPPPIPLPDVVVSLVYESNVEQDPGHMWFRELIREVSDMQSRRKATLYEQLRFQAASQ